MTPCQSVQFPADQGHKLIQRTTVTPTPSRQQSGDFA
jgi:hypothetical protein